MFFNRDSTDAEPKGSASDIQGFHGTAGARHLRPLDAFSRLLVGPKCTRICGRGFAPNTAGGAYSAPSDPLAGGEGFAARNPFLALGLRPRISALQASGVFPPKDMGSISNQNCCKGFCFTEKVEKHWVTW